MKPKDNFQVIFTNSVEVGGSLLDSDSLYGDSIKSRLEGLIFLV
jgi:hypothetical protein